MNQRWDFSSLFKTHLWIVTGKGGTGKTTVTAALGLLGASHGLKTLMVETHGLNHLGDLFEVGKVGYQPKSIRNGLSLAQLNVEEAFEEYVLRQIKFKFIYNAVFNNHYVKNFIDAAPGLSELLTIGKIWALVEDEVRVGKKRNYDLVIVDAPATGHGLSLLTVAQIVVDAVRVGPMKNHADGIIKLLQNPNETLTWLVTLPEEMPVNETVEIEKKLVDQAKVEVGPILINSLWPNILSDTSQKEFRKEKFKDELLKSYEERREQCDFYTTRIKEEFSHRHLIGLPLIYQSSTPLQVAQHLQGVIHQNILGKSL